MILPDLPFEEKDEFLPLCKKYSIDLISMIAPTSAERISMIAREATGFLYIVSSLGVTGTRSEITTDLKSIMDTVRESTNISQVEITVLDQYIVAGVDSSTPCTALQDVDALVRLREGDGAKITFHDVQTINLLKILIPHSYFLTNRVTFLF